MHGIAILAAAALAAAAWVPAAWAAEDAPTTPPGARTYSPYPQQTFPNRVFFGDTHLHTSFSPDAGMIGNTLGPDQAYRFARGETVASSTGLPARLSRPHDFLVVADHAESIGAGPAIQRGDPVVMKSEFGRQLHEFTRAGEPQKAYDLWLKAGREGTNALAGELELSGPSWKTIAETADRFDEPGRLTAFIGYEWSAHPNGNNLHRVVVYRDGADRAVQSIPISRDDTVDPEDLWKWRCPTTCP